MTMNANNDIESASLAPDGREAEPRSEPPQVYCVANAEDQWVVDPPRSAPSSEGKKVFTGPRAQYLALVYAHEKFGNARFFPC
jgi:hypothetical protein